MLKGIPEQYVPGPRFQSYEGDIKMLTRLVKFQVRLAALRSDRGATAVEYGLMVALIAVVIIGAVTLLGNQLSSLFTGVTAKLPTP
jgi:pilus assembly protein Flp/PilA